MDGSLRTIGLAVGLLLAVVGCAASPWSAFRAAPRTDEATTTDTAEGNSGKSAADTPDGDSSAELDQSGKSEAALPEARELNALMAELQQLGALDPDAQQQLMEDLRQTDPAMWNPIMARFRASLAYRRRTERRPQDRPLEEVPSAGGHSESNREVDLGDWRGDPASPRDISAPGRSGKSGQRSMLAGRSPLPEPDAGPSGNAEPSAARHSPRDAAPGDSPKGDARSGRNSSEPLAARHDEKITPASYDDRAEADWQERLASTIHTLESELRSDPESEAEIARHAYLRLLYLVAGRRDDALRPLPAASSSAQDFWANEMYGLEGWLNADRTADPRVRAAEARKSLDDAVVKLGEMAPLVVNGLAFCTAIQSFGCYTEFEKHEFVPDQEVLLYAEVENFKSERMPKGYHTALRSSYKIFDNRGQQVAEHEFPVTEEFCQSKRRDFFIGYHLRLPERIYSGPHTLRLTIEDLKKNQIGQASIEFTVRAAEK